MMRDICSQEPYRCKLDWGAVGALRASKRGDIVVIVDVLSFSTAVVHAVSLGGVVYPCGEHEDAVKLASGLGAEVAVGRAEVPGNGRFSLSPQTFDHIPSDTKVLLPSLNGGTCTRCAASGAEVAVGALINSSAVARIVSAKLANSDRSITVIACGEREKGSGELRPAIEDYLGAGAILAGLAHEMSPEAAVCRSAFEANKHRLSDLIWDSVSGRELRETGFGDDVGFAGRLDTHEVVPVMRGDVLVDGRD